MESVQKYKQHLELKGNLLATDGLCVFPEKGWKQGFPEKHPGFTFLVSEEMVSHCRGWRKSKLPTHSVQH